MKSIRVNLLFLFRLGGLRLVWAVLREDPQWVYNNRITFEGCNDDSN